MAIRQIRVMGDDILEKKSKEVKEITPRIKELIDDMLDTMYAADGVGLSAVQVGVLKRIVVIDTSEEKEEPLIMINPKIVDRSGEQTGQEGCLSLPGKAGEVTRPNYIKVLYFDKNMQPREMEATDVMARTVCHECDHLDGKLYVNLVHGELQDIAQE